VSAEPCSRTFCYNSFVMIDSFLVPEKTVVTAKGDGPALDVSSAGNRTLLLTLQITGIIEQESIDVSVYGSPDGAAWSAKPLLKFPQKFYHGDHPALLDVPADVKFLRAHWDVNRWGRGTETPHFEFHVTAKEVPADVLSEASSRSKALVG
jgi:hypothetical protein